MKETRAILDLGIGLGGRYINESTNRIGVDKNALWPDLVAATYHIPCVVAENERLPFASGSFDTIEMYYPDDIFLPKLLGKSGVWPEFRRVLEANGSVEITLETIIGAYPTGHRLLILGGEPTPIYDIVNRIQDAAARENFSTASRELAADEIRTIGTHYAEHYLFEKYRHYRITAQK